MQVSSSSTALISYDPALPHISMTAYLNKVSSSRLEGLLKQVDEVVKNQKNFYVKNSWSDREVSSHIKFWIETSRDITRLMEIKMPDYIVAHRELKAKITSLSN